MGTSLIHRLQWPLRVTGAGLLAATAAIHLDLYLTGYSTIHVIGVLFLLQVIVAFALALAVLASPLVARGSWVPNAASAAAGAGFAIATLGGYLLSLWVGLFGFREVRTTAGVVAGVIEIAAFAVLGVLAADSLPGVKTATAASAFSVPARNAVPASGVAGPTASTVPAGRTDPAGAAASPSVGNGAGGRPGPGTQWLTTLRRAAAPVVAGIGVVALAVLGVSVATANGGAAPTSAGGQAVLRTDAVGGVTVLTDSKGLTLYWFAPDTPTTSACYGTCAAYWPPVFGTPVVGTGVAGVTGALGTIHRTDGTLQATYNGHPLYTYIGDTAPGQASGNNINLNGGFWHEVTVTG